MSGNQPTLWDSIIASNPVVWLGAIGTAAGAWAAALRTIRTTRLDAEKARTDTAATKAAADAKLAERMSADVAAAFQRQTDEIGRLTLDIARRDQTIEDLRSDVELGWGKGRAMEAAFYLFARHDFGNVQQVNESLYRALSWLLETPVDPDRRIRAQQMLDIRKPSVEPVVPTLADIEGRKAP